MSLNKYYHESDYDLRMMIAALTNKIASRNWNPEEQTNDILCCRCVQGPERGQQPASCPDLAKVTLQQQSCPADPADNRFITNIPPRNVSCFTAITDTRLPARPLVLLHFNICPARTQ
ncbi:hypothetical protein J6590_097451 [Homalodisca vitripennis]|nr:hypothetical protein J6590_023646 [Homalodisca vitripennis]KAG8289782.1 hypothetical protein J6590_097451 [Homalodisca vitripennis]